MQPEKDLTRKPSLYEAWRFDFATFDPTVARSCEGGRHSWWHNPAQNKRSAVPHNEIDTGLARKICKDLGVPPLT